MVFFLLLEMIWFVFHIHKNGFLFQLLLKPFLFSWLSEQKFVCVCVCVFFTLMFCFCSSREASIFIPLLFGNSTLKHRNNESATYNESFKGLRLNPYGFYLIMLPLGIRWAPMRYHIKLSSMKKNRRFLPRSFRVWFVFKPAEVT